MPRHQLPLLLCGLLTTACDESDEVDRGAKPIEALQADAGLNALRTVQRQLDDVQLDAVRLVATGTVADAPLAMIVDDEGTIVGAAMREGGEMQWLDVDALAEGELELLEGRPSDLAAAELLQRLLDQPAKADTGPDQLAPLADPTPVQCPPPLRRGGPTLEPNC